MIISPASLQATFVTFNAIFNDAFQATPTFHQDIAMTRTSGAESEVYAMLAQIPEFKKFVGGEREWANLAAYSQTLINDVLVNGYKVPRDKIADDQIGTFHPAFAMMGARAKKIWDRLLIKAIKAGISTAIYDNQFFFDTDHAVDPSKPALGTQSNYFTGTALTAANYRARRAAMKKLKGENAEILGVSPTHLVVGADLEGTGRELLEADRNAAGATNIDRGTAKLLVIDELDWDGRWMLLDLSKPIKPFVVQVREAPVLQALDQPTMPHVVELREFRYDGSARGAAGYGLWQLATLCAA